MNTWKQLSEYQPNIVKMLTNSIKKDRVAHAYLFEGGRGTGKKATSILFAKTLFCQHVNETEPCHQCVECRRIESGNHPDVHFLSPDGQSLKKEQIRQLQREFSKTGVESNRKIYIIEHANKMTTQAANSLLKFLEEPSKMTVAILLTEQVHQILPTILSRCQTLSFKPLIQDQLISQLENKEIPNHMSRILAALTNDLEEALAIIEDDWFAQARNIVIQLIEILYKRPNQALFFIQEKWLPHFKDKEQFDRGLDLLLIWYNDLIYIKLGEEKKVVYTDQYEQLKTQSLHSSEKRILRQMTAILEAKKRLHANVNTHLLMEQLVFQLQEG